jgi:transposase
VRGASIDPQGYDAGKKVTGRKRHIMVDTLGLMLGIVVHPANVQDRDGAEALLRQTRRSFPFIEVIFADGGYQGPIMAAVTAKTGSGGWRSSSATTFLVSRCCPNAGSSNEL